LASKSVWILNHYAIMPDIAGGTRHFDLGKELVKRVFFMRAASSFITVCAANGISRMGV